MGGLLDLSPELLLCVASFLRQVDLLNVSLTCKYLSAATLPELYREYQGLHQRYKNGFAKVTKRILEQPELGRHFRHLVFNFWRTLGEFNPDFHDGSESDFDLFRSPEPTRAEYKLFTDAAKAAGVIDSIYPYEEKSYVIQRAKYVAFHGMSPAGQMQPWYEYAYDPEIRINDVPYDRKFCQLLRAGVDDPFVTLLLALLPNIRELDLHGAPHDVNTLPWKMPPHRFQSLRRLNAMATDGELSWPIAYFNDMYKSPKLTTMEVAGGSCWWRGPDDMDSTNTSSPVRFSLQPASLHVQTLIFHFCAIPRVEMKTLLDACPRLKAFYYSTGSQSVGPVNFTPAEIVELLEPHKDSLEDLSLEILPYGAESERIQSLAHFTSLKLLDTVPDMWAELTEVDLIDEITEAQFLSCRLPQSLQTLIFHHSEDSDGILIEHLEELLQSRRSLGSFPHLINLGVSTPHHDILSQLRILKAEDAEAEAEAGEGLEAEDGEFPRRELSPLALVIRKGDHIWLPVHAAYYGIERVPRLPQTFWGKNEKAYVRKRAKPKMFERAIREFQAEQRATGREPNEADMLEFACTCPEILALRENRDHHEETEWESASERQMSSEDEHTPEEEEWWTGDVDSEEDEGEDWLEETDSTEDDSAEDDSADDE